MDGDCYRYDMKQTTDKNWKVEGGEMKILFLRMVRWVILTLYFYYIGVFYQKKGWCNWRKQTIQGEWRPSELGDWVERGTVVKKGFVGVNLGDCQVSVLLGQWEELRVRSWAEWGQNIQKGGPCRWGSCQGVDRLQWRRQWGARVFTEGGQERYGGRSETEEGLTKCTAWSSKGHCSWQIQQTLNWYYVTYIYICISYTVELTQVNFFRRSH